MYKDYKRINLSSSQKGEADQWKSLLNILHIQNEPP